MQGEHKYARRPNGAWTRRSASPYRADKFRMRRQSCCDALRHAFANLALKYRFATCISAACRDTFLRTARLWRSSRAARIKYIAVAHERNARLNFTRSLLASTCMHSASYTRRDAASATQKCSGAKYNNAASGPAVHKTSRKSGGALKFTLSQAFKNRPFKISPTRRSQKSAFKIFSPAQILKSAL